MNAAVIGVFRILTGLGRRLAASVRSEKSMGWATGHIERLRSGETVSFRPRGSSMSGKIESGQLCTVEPVESAVVRVGDVVLCKVKGEKL